MVLAETARLVLRRPREPDIEPLMAMDADPEVMRYIGSGAVVPPDRDRALRSLARWRRQWDEQGFGMCSVIVRETGEYAGWVTLAVPAFLPEVLPAVEIGWRLRREHGKRPNDLPCRRCKIRRNARQVAARWQVAVPPRTGIVAQRQRACV